MSFGVSQHCVAKIVPSSIQIMKCRYSNHSHDHRCIKSAHRLQTAWMSRSQELVPCQDATCATCPEMSSLLNIPQSYCSYNKVGMFGNVLWVPQLCATAHRHACYTNLSTVTLWETDNPSRMYPASCPIISLTGSGPRSYPEMTKGQIIQQGRCAESILTHAVQHSSHSTYFKNILPVLLLNTC